MRQIFNSIARFRSGAIMGALLFAVCSAVTVPAQASWTKNMTSVTGTFWIGDVNQSAVVCLFTAGAWGTQSLNFDGVGPLDDNVTIDMSASDDTVRFVRTGGPTPPAGCSTGGTIGPLDFHGFRVTVNLNDGRDSYYGPGGTGTAINAHGGDEDDWIFNYVPSGGTFTGGLGNDDFISTATSSSEFYAGAEGDDCFEDTDGARLAASTCGSGTDTHSFLTATTSCENYIVITSLTCILF